MPRLSITDLPVPLPQYDIRSTGWFEPIKSASRWDRRRARQLRERARHWTGQRRARGLALADKLDPKLTLKSPDSPASSRYMRDMRVRIVGGLCKVVADDRTGIIARYDVIKAKHAYRAPAIWHLTAVGMKREFNADLDRAAAKVVPGGAAACEGILFAAIHGDFEEPTNRFQLHWHLVATGDWVAVVEGLKDQRGYKPSARVRRPIQRKEDPTDLAYCLSYLVKSYWPGKWRGFVSGVKAKRRSRSHREIDPKFGCHGFLWLDDQRLDDMILTRGLFVGKEGLRVSSC